MRAKKFLLTAVLATVAAVCFAAAGCAGPEVPSGSNGRPEDTANYTPSRTVTATQVVTYEGPRLMKSSEAVGVSVEGKDLFVYETRVNHGRVNNFKAPDTTNPVVIFDFEGSVTVKVTVKSGSVQSALVRPLSYGVEPKVNGNVIEFRLDYPAAYVVEYNGDPETAVHLFTNEIETEEPDPNNLPENTVYIGPGVYHAGAIPVKSDTTVYIAGGALVYGQIRAENVKNLTIRGRGIIDGSIFPRTVATEYTLPVEIRYSENVKIEDLTFLDPAGWVITLYRSKDVTIDNVKMITARSNGDGISVQSSENVTVTGGFVRTWDDSLVVKNRDNVSTKNITFDGVTVWTDLAQSMEVGYEAYGPEIKDVLFKNITVLHNFHKPAMSIHNADNANISGITYQNITIEDAAMRGDYQNEPNDDLLMEFSIAYNQAWSSPENTVRGTISNVTVSNVKILNAIDTLSTRIAGLDENSQVKDVRFFDIEMNGKAVEKGADIGLSDAAVYSSGVSFAYDAALVTGARVKLPYLSEISEGNVADIAQKASIDQTGVSVPEFAVIDAEPPYMGVKAEGAFTASATHGTGDKANSAYDDGSGAWEKADTPASNLLDGDKATRWTAKAWLGQSDEFAALSVEFDAPRSIGVIRLFGDPDNRNYGQFKIAVFGKAEGSDKYTRKLSALEYRISPSDGNYADIKVSAAQKYQALQLRVFRTDGILTPTEVSFTEIEFYPPSLAYNGIVTATNKEDVYDAKNVVDGDNNTYYESKKGMFPAEITVDMGVVHAVSHININLPLIMTWEPRTQNIEVLVSTDGETYVTAFAAADYVFDPATGNRVALKLDAPVNARYVKLVYRSNSSGYGAQLSELYVFGV